MRGGQTMGGEAETVQESCKMRGIFGRKGGEKERDERREEKRKREER